LKRFGEEIGAHQVIVVINDEMSSN
jgi:hypothetical protein